MSKTTPKTLPPKLSQHNLQFHLREGEHVHHVRCVGAVVCLPREQEVLICLIYDKPSSCICCDPREPVENLTRQGDPCVTPSLKGGLKVSLHIVRR